MSESVDFRHLKYLVAVAETGNFTRAAERLFLSQPALSKTIKDIETDIGVPLFERTREGVIPTPLGTMVIEYASATLSTRKQIFTLVKEIFLGNISPLRVGFSCFVNSRHLQAFRAAYSKQFPNCLLQPSGGDTVHVLQRLERGDLDCALLPLPINGPKWVVEQIASTPLVACMRRDDPLAQDSDVSLAALAEHLTIFRDPDSHPSAHERLLQMLTESGHQVHITCSAATPHDIQLLVRDGYGIALVGEDTIVESDVTTRRISGIQWTADTAFVYQVGARHPALPYISACFAKRTLEYPGRKAQTERPQLSLKFDLVAS